MQREIKNLIDNRKNISLKCYFSEMFESFNIMDIIVIGLFVEAANTILVLDFVVLIIRFFFFLT